MPREKPLFRETLDRLDTAFPNRELISYKEAATFLGVSTKTIQRNYKKASILSKISKVKFASALAE